MPNANFTVAIADWREFESVMREIRREVFVLEQGVEQSLEDDPNDFLHTHVLATDADGHGIATGRIQADGQIGRMAVRAEWRGRGVGAAILDALIAGGAARGLANFTLNAQISAKRFYAAHGFTEVGAVFWEAGIEHIKMTRGITSFPK